MLTLAAQALTVEHQDWKLTHQRMVKILKREGKVSAPIPTAVKENAAETVFSPKTMKRVKAADEPVDSKNILQDRLRPESKLR